MQALQQLLLDPLKTTWVEVVSKVGSVLPKILAALIILIFGWIIAKILSGISKRILVLIQFDRLATKAGIDEFLAKGGVKRSAVQLLGGLVYWFFLILTFIAAFSAVGLTAVVAPLTSILLYIPNIFVVILILIFGAYVAAFTDSVVRAYSSNVGLNRPELAGRISRALVLLFAIIIALEQLRLETNLITQVFLLSVASLGLGAAIAIGLGAKELTKGYLEKLIRPRK
ncbi:MAG TPA: hypothetical protein VJ165_01685 [candidate division Zixibacteria bacterium]|nr:hypothetical protein [candidate division Zixibacteria bacterium]